MKADTDRKRPGDYITHHLQNLQVCKNDAGEWVWNQCAGNMGAINVDSMFWSVFLGLVFVISFRNVAKKTHRPKNRASCRPSSR